MDANSLKAGLQRPRSAKEKTPGFTIGDYRSTIRPALETPRQNIFRSPRYRALAVVCVLLSSLCAVFAHTPSETYLTLSLAGTNLTGRWDVALRDLHQGMGLTSEEAEQVAAATLQQREEALVLDVAAGLALRADVTLLKLAITDYTTLPLNDVQYVRLIFQAANLTNTPSAIELNAAAVFRVDTNMHGLLRLEFDGRTEAVAFNAQRPAHRFELSSPGGHWARWITFV